VDERPWVRNLAPSLRDHEVAPRLFFVGAQHCLPWASNGYAPGLQDHKYYEGLRRLNRIPIAEMGPAGWTPTKITKSNRRCRAKATALEVHSLLIARSQNTRVPTAQTGASQRTALGRPVPAKASAIPTIESKQPMA